MAKRTSIPSSYPEIYKEHCSHLGISDPERQVLKEAGSTLSAQPLLADFSPVCLSSHTMNTHFSFLVELCLFPKQLGQLTCRYTYYKKRFNHTPYFGNPKESNSPIDKPPLHLLRSTLISYASAQAANSMFITNTDRSGALAGIACLSSSSQFNVYNG